MSLSHEQLEKQLLEERLDRGGSVTKNPADAPLTFFIYSDGFLEPTCTLGVLVVMRIISQKMISLMTQLA
jgi:hypothetical protein